MQCITLNKYAVFFCLFALLWRCSTVYVMFWSICFSVRKQVVNVPSYIVRLDSQKYIDLAHDSALAGGRPGRVKRKNAKKGQAGGDEEDED